MWTIGRNDKSGAILRQVFDLSFRQSDFRTSVAAKRRQNARRCHSVLLVELGIAGASSAVQAQEKSITVFAAAVAHAVAPAVG
jgi:hypothetical protein